MDRKAALEINKTKRVRPVGFADWFQVGELQINHLRFLGRVEWEVEISLEEMTRERDQWKRIAENIDRNPVVKVLRFERDEYKRRIDRCVHVMSPHIAHQWVKYVTGILLDREDWEAL